MRKLPLRSARLLSCLWLLLALLTCRLAPAQQAEQPVRRPEPLRAEVCVYGGTSGGVVAAVQAARMGKQVVLLEPGNHLGGMTSGGLSAVDIGDPRSIGGIAREYFTRLVSRYGKQLPWDQPFRRSGGPATGGAYSIEPHVAEQLFDQMARQAKVTVWRNARLDRVRKEGASIVEATTEDGRVVRARAWIDTTYEGDLMAAAGVRYTVKREGNAKYGETYNGIHYSAKYRPRLDHQSPGANGRVPGGQGVWDRDLPLDPYLRPGDPASGLLPLVDSGEPGEPGEPADGIQAYCYRLCLTTAEDRIPIAPPPDYDAAQYELVARFIAGCVKLGDDMDLRWFSKHDPLPNDKWDFNTATFGGNLPGANWEWPEASYDQRDRFAQRLENYHRGLLHFLATDPRVPSKVRHQMQRFGLPRDEFLDNGGWPHQVYIREGRRMVSDFVMTEHHTFGRSVAPDSIGLGSYGTDTHEIRRIVKDGVVAREGKTATGRGGFGPYQIGYGAIVPSQAECDNLLVTFALSASHTAFSSIRMEPVFMVTSQSAATAACLAIDADIPVQQLPYSQLRPRLVGDGQVLQWESSKITRGEDLAGVVIDQPQAEFTGQWTTSNRRPTHLGSSYHHDGNSDRGNKQASFTAHLPQAGLYEVRLLYTAHENRSSKTRVTIESDDETKTVLVNQRLPALVDRVPRSLGVFSFSPDKPARVIVSNRGADGYTVVDGVQLVPQAIADQERSGELDSGFAVSTREASAEERTEVTAPLPVPAATLNELHNRPFDLVVIEATPAGVACAVRAAREGLRVLLVNRTEHLGGILSSGLGVWDTLWEGKRSPIYDELREEIFEHYRSEFGEESAQYRNALPGTSGHTNGKFEPHVVEALITDMVRREPGITVLSGFIPRAVQRRGRLIESVLLQQFRGEQQLQVRPQVVADCSYEGDLLPLAEIPYRVGRESRDEFDEPHAGRVFMKPAPKRPAFISEPHWKAHQRLPLRKFSGFQEIVVPQSTGLGDGNVQAFNYRTILTSDPDNRLPIRKPLRYEPDFLRTLEWGSRVRPIPNEKIGWNRPQLVGLHQAYVEGDWETRQQVMDAHWEAAMALLYFLQHDDSVPPATRGYWRKYGLAKDEFSDHQHRPYEIYVRESRRLQGRFTLAQHHLMPMPHTDRPPPIDDAIAMTDWYMDSHAVTPGKIDGSLDEGKMMLHAETWPGQISWRCLLPREVDNLLVPVCLSASHVAWGAIRLEPTWMQTGEAAGFAAALARQLGTTPGQLDPDELQRLLIQNDFLICFLADLPESGTADFAAAQYFGAKGFFNDYHARLDDPVCPSTAEIWKRAASRLPSSSYSAGETAVAVHRAESSATRLDESTRGELLRAMWGEVDRGAER